MSLVSVIIPVFNGEKTIRKTLDSILSQTLKDLEIIVINDGSSDSTEEIVKNISDERLQIFSYPNAGLPASRNRGVSHANSEFISFIDADDIWTQNKLESQLKSILASESAAVSYSWTDYIDENGKIVKSGRRVTNVGDVYSKLLISNFLENGSNPLIRRSALATVGGFDESLTAAEDWDMWLRLAAHYDFVIVPEVQILYRISLNSMSTNLKRQESASLIVIERAFSEPKALALQHLKKRSLAYLYRYLTFKALEANPAQQNSYLALKFLWKCIIHDPSFIKQIKLLSIALVKIYFSHIYYYLIQFKNKI
ncbi:putative glycosyltransferase [Nostoc sp. PCC 7524]|uniref:glycosyltransferase n=1 Tax=Nostoc sp. (strain ATCC 29411 / PCC 7524) TaxID=28072 RepID=UPI00029F135F|nr:glycosyltransferase [Nostoc sp. PCC 7524]AFY50939.1 putative glycosyltransferase [Nostoc sp. PCC 7524]